jgi:hypothetical protein
LIYELAGLLRIDPGPFTLRQLCWMADAASRDRWQHTASLMALMANCHRDAKKSRAFRPKDFHPFEKSRRSAAERKPPKVGIGVLKQVFVDRRPLSANE